MGTERMEETVAACPCGKGAIKESFWSNDHAFATDYSWHSEGLRIDCGPCAKAWAINGSDAKEVRVATRAAADVAAKHNAAAEEQLRKLATDQFALERDLSARVLALRKALVAKAEAAGAGVEAKFNAVGEVLGFSTLSAFRTAVGRTQPKTYVPQLVTPSTTPIVLERIGRDDEAESFRHMYGKVREFTKSRKALQATIKQPATAKVLPRIG